MPSSAATADQVETGELMRLETHRPGLEGHVRGRLPGVVVGVRRLVPTFAPVVGRELGADQQDQ